MRTHINCCKLHHTLILISTITKLVIYIRMCVWVWYFYKFILLKNKCTSLLPINTDTVAESFATVTKHPCNVDCLNCCKQVWIPWAFSHWPNTHLLSSHFLCPFNGKSLYDVCSYYFYRSCWVRREKNKSRKLSTQSECWWEMVMVWVCMHFVLKKYFCFHVNTQTTTHK